MSRPRAFFEREHSPGFRGTWYRKWSLNVIHLGPFSIGVRFSVSRSREKAGAPDWPSPAPTSSSSPRISQNPEVPWHDTTLYYAASLPGTAAMEAPVPEGMPGVYTPLRGLDYDEGIGADGTYWSWRRERPYASPSSTGAPAPTDASSTSIPTPSPASPRSRAASSK